MASDAKHKRKLTTMRRHQTKAMSPYNLGGRKKEGKNAPKPITLATTPYQVTEKK